jgi:hypothetical protein
MNKKLAAAIALCMFTAQGWFGRRKHWRPRITASLWGLMPGMQIIPCTPLIMMVTTALPSTGAEMVLP